jgi:LacI family transcriptional regulator
MSREERITIDKVAKIAGVSKATVSRVINSKDRVDPTTRQRVKNVISKLGYEPLSTAKALRTGRTHLLGCVVSDITNEFTSLFIDGVWERSRECGYKVLLGLAGSEVPEEEDFVDLLENGIVDGLILTPSGWYDYDSLRDGLERLRQKELPFVTVGRVGNGYSDIDNVDVNVFEGAEEAVSYLIGLGHRRIGYIGGTAKWASESGRFRAYKETLIRCGFEYHPEYVVTSGKDNAAGRKGFVELWKRDLGITSVVTMNDMVAEGVLRAAEALNIRVPQDISVIGFDDAPLCEVVSPKLTSVVLPKRELGKVAVELLMERLGVPPRREPKHITLKSKLMVRESTGRCVI